MASHSKSSLGLKRALRESSLPPMMAELTASPSTEPSGAPAAIALVPTTPPLPGMFSTRTGTSRMATERFGDRAPHLVARATGRRRDDQVDRRMDGPGWASAVRASASAGSAARPANSTATLAQSGVRAGYVHVGPASLPFGSRGSILRKGGHAGNDSGGTEMSRVRGAAGAVRRCARRRRRACSCRCRSGPPSRRCAACLMTLRAAPGASVVSSRSCGNASGRTTGLRRTRFIDAISRRGE